MTEPLLIIVSGLPGTGKTTLAQRIAQEFGLPLLYKDGIKERLFDTLGWRDRAWSRQLGMATYELLFYFVEILAATGGPFIVESNFYPNHTARFRAIQERHPFTPVQIICTTDGAVLFERYRQRAESGVRHPGHVDRQSYDEMEPLLRQGASAPLALDGPVRLVDTTDFAVIDYAGLFQMIRTALGRTV